jgi:hypothetical protein
VAPGADEDPVYGRALSATWQWLNERAASGGVDFGSSALPPPVGTDGKVQSDVLAVPSHRSRAETPLDRNQDRTVAVSA